MACTTCIRWMVWNESDSNQIFYSYNCSTQQLQSSLIGAGQFYSVCGCADNGAYASSNEVYFENGRVQWSGDYKNGVEDGTWTFYYESGRVKVSETYSNGKEHGLRTEYDSSGRKVKEEQWKHGKLMKETRFQ